VISAVDTNVILDVLNDDERFASRSTRAMQAALGDGALMACDVVWAEIGAWFPAPEDAVDAMGGFGIRFAALDPEVAAAAGRVWHRYRSERGTRERMLPDFLIGTHAWMRADALITRDRGFYRAYFKRLKVIDPSSG
jgi:predicted nucleic acid-binding protein